MTDYGQHCHGYYFYGFGSGLVVCGGKLMVGGGSFWGHMAGVCTGREILCLPYVGFSFYNKTLSSFDRV